jgi:hypothetical protein
VSEPRKTPSKKLLQMSLPDMQILKLSNRLMFLSCSTD